ncbi:MAG TPA: hypothetical protein VE869_13150, partial [Gemmatimonas sp.]|nr:hypothetical protein [Gemmatimonas sp.]
YAHTVRDAYIPQEYLPDSLVGTTFYEPGPFGFEKDIAKRLAWWAELRERKRHTDANLPVNAAVEATANAAAESDEPSTGQST